MVLEAPWAPKRPAKGGPRGFQTELKRRLEQKDEELAESSIFTFFSMFFNDFEDSRGPCGGPNRCIWSHEGHLNRIRRPEGLLRPLGAVLKASGWLLERSWGA